MKYLMGWLRLRPKIFILILILNRFLCTRAMGLALISLKFSLVILSL